MTEEEIKEKIAKALAQSPTGLRIGELFARYFTNEKRTREFLYEMKENNYVKVIGTTSTTRYEITPQGRLRYLTNNEESPLEQNEKTSVETLQPAQIVEESVLKQNFQQDDSLIEEKPYPFVTDSVIEDFETRSITHDAIFADLDFPSTQKHFFAELDDNSVYSPLHYNQGGIECIEALQSCLSESEYIGFLKGNAIKYLWRMNDKATPQENLKKARWYIDTLLETFE